MRRTTTDLSLLSVSLSSTDSASSPSNIFGIRFISIIPCLVPLIAKPTLHSACSDVESSALGGANEFLHTSATCRTLSLVRCTESSLVCT